MVAAFYTHHYNGFSYTVAGVFESWISEEAKYYVYNRTKYSNDFNEPEISDIIQCLEKINVDNITSIIVNGYAWDVDENGDKKPGFGKTLQKLILEKFEAHITVVCVSRTIETEKLVQLPIVEVFRCNYHTPLYVSCSEECHTEYWGQVIKTMFGEHRIPDGLKYISSKAKDFCDEIEKESGHLEPIDINMGGFDQWLKETEERGFSYKEVT